MNFKNKWVLVAIAIVVIAIIIMIANKSEEPVLDPETTTTTLSEEIIIDDMLPVEGDVIIDGEDVFIPDVVDPMETEPTE